MIYNIMNYKSDLKIIDEYDAWKGIQNFWDAKVYALAILIGGFSVIWPYVKVIMMILCWFLP